MPENNVKLKVVFSQSVLSSWVRVGMVVTYICMDSIYLLCFLCLWNVSGFVVDGFLFCFVFKGYRLIEAIFWWAAGHTAMTFTFSQRLV